MTQQNTTSTWSRAYDLEVLRGYADAEQYTISECFWEGGYDTEEEKQAAGARGTKFQAIENALNANNEEAHEWALVELEQLVSEETLRMWHEQEWEAYQQAKIQAEVEYAEALAWDSRP